MAAAKKTKRLKVSDDLTLTLPVKLPFAIQRHINSKSGAMDVAGVLEEILGEDQAEKVWDLGLDMDEGAELVDKIISSFGVDSGK